MRVIRIAAATALLAGAASANDVIVPTSSTSSAPACTATSSTGSGAFFDLRPDTAIKTEVGKTPKYGAVSKDYFARGYDYGSNFTLNICGSVVDTVQDVDGVDEQDWPNVGAYYTLDGTVYSIGNESMKLQSRGRKLVLQYKNGSPCGSTNDSHSARHANEARAVVEARDTDDDDLRSDGYRYDDSAIAPVPSTLDTSDTTRRKSTTISFLCDRDPTNTQATVAFVGTDPEECAYFFEVRTSHACALAEPHKPGSVGPGSVFGIILIIAVLVYVLGGVFYNRTITHARGWRQLPNYSLWAGMWNTITDLFASVCGRCLPSRSGYSQLNANARNRDAEAENRLIDQLDEDWDD